MASPARCGFQDQEVRCAIWHTVQRTRYDLAPEYSWKIFYVRREKGLVSKDPEKTGVHAANEGFEDQRVGGSLEGWSSGRMEARCGVAGLWIGLCIEGTERREG